MASSSRRGDRASNRPTCEPCRQRKVRCNRQIPCSQCSRLRLSCIYETRTRRRPISASFGQSIRRNPLPHLSSQSPINSEDGSPHHCNDQPTNKDIIDRLSRIEESLSGLIQGLNCGGQLKKCMIEETSVNSEKKPPAAVLVPPAQYTGEIPVDDRARGSYVDDPMFMRLYLVSLS